MSQKQIDPMTPDEALLWAKEQISERYDGGASALFFCRYCDCPGVQMRNHVLKHRANCGWLRFMAAAALAEARSRASGVL